MRHKKIGAGKEQNEVGPSRLVLFGNTMKLILANGTMRFNQARGVIRMVFSDDTTILFQTQSTRELVLILVKNNNKFGPSWKQN